jgi:hypothetical protein
VDKRSLSGFDYQELYFPWLFIDSDSRHVWRCLFKTCVARKFCKRFRNEFTFATLCWETIGSSQSVHSTFMSLEASEFRRFCPGSSFYIAPVLRAGNSIGEEYPKKCDSSWKPPIESFIHRSLPPPPDVICLPFDPSLNVSPAGLVLGKEHNRLRGRQPSQPITPLKESTRTRPAGLRVRSVLPFNILWFQSLITDRIWGTNSRIQRTCMT